MRISYNNLLRKSGAILSATNQNDNFPVSNLISNYLELPFKALGDNADITIELDNDYTIDHIVIGYHNLDTLTVRYLDNLDAEISNTVITIDQNRPIDFIYDTVVDVKKIVLEMTTTDTILYLGGFSTGNYFQFPDFLAEPSTPYSLRGNSKLSGSAQLSGVNLRNIRLYNYSFRCMTEIDYFTLESVFDEVGKALAHFVDVYENNREVLTHRPFWGSIESGGDSGQKEFDNNMEMSFNISYKRVY